MLDFPIPGPLQMRTAHLRGDGVGEERPQL